MTEKKKVVWSIVKFPVELRHAFVGEARTRNITTPALLEEVLRPYLRTPKQPEHVIEVQEGEFTLWNAGSFPADLKNKFVGLSYKYDLTVAELLTTILINWFKKEKATSEQ